MFVAPNKKNEEKIDLFYVLVECTDKKLQLWKEDVIASLIDAGFLCKYKGKLALEWR